SRTAFFQVDHGRRCTLDLTGNVRSSTVSTLEFLFHRRIWNPYSYSKTPQPGLCSSNTPKESPSLSQKAGNPAPFHASLLLMSNSASEVFFGTYTAGTADNPGIWRSVFDA